MRQGSIKTLFRCTRFAAPGNRPQPSDRTACRIEK
jgi:hypothetical protein